MASSLITGGTGITVVTLVPPVEWILNGCPHPIPESVPYLIAAGILMACHAIFNCINKEGGEKGDTQAIQPTQQPSQQPPQVQNEPIQPAAPIQGVYQNVVAPMDAVGNAVSTTTVSTAPAVTTRSNI